MLCIAVTPTSRTLAKVDLLNAARRADLVELCLDHLSKDPDVGDLLAACPKPVIVSCRRPRDGGQYAGSEGNRLGLLRQAIIAGPAYVELDPDAAAALPRFGETKRLIAHHSPDRPLKKIEAAVDRAVKELHADAVKFTWPTPTLAAAWPLIYAVSQKLDVPVVGQGIGAGGLTFSLVARRLGSPWIYAALERGMEDVAGQPTVEELETTHDARAIGPATRFVACAGFPGEADALEGTGGNDDASGGAICRTWNAAARSAGVPHRALPLEVGKFDHLADMLQILKVRAVALGPALRADARAGWAAFAPVSSPDASSPQADGSAVATVALKGKEGWRGVASAREATADALAAVCGGMLERRQVTLIGAGPGSEALGRALLKRGATLAVADPNDDAAADLARRLDARGMRWRAIYTTRTDALIRAERGAGSPKAGPSEAGAGPVPVGSGPKAYNAAAFEPRLIVADACAVWSDTDFLTAARRHACTLAEPAAVREAVLANLFAAVTGAEWPG